MRILDEALTGKFKKGFSGVVLVADDGKIILKRPVGYRNFEGWNSLKRMMFSNSFCYPKQFTAMLCDDVQEKALARPS